MGRHVRNSEALGKPHPRPSITPEGREDQLVGLAINLAEQQLRDGTASSQVITHYLKLGSSRDRLERELMEEKKKLMEAKTEAIRSSERLEEMFREAIDAMKVYNPND